MSRSFFLVAMVATLALSGHAAWSQDTLPAPAEIKKFSPLVGGVHLSRAEVAGGQLRTARKAIAGKIWQAAAEALQAALESPPASVVQAVRTGPDGKEHTYWVGAHAEAGRLLATLPKEGLDAYEKQYGDAARKLLDRAKKKDLALLTDVVDRYRFTQAGAEGLALLAGHYFADGWFFHAAQCYGMWQEHRSARMPKPLELYQMTLASRRADSPERAEKSWKQLSNQLGQKKLKIGDEEFTLEQARECLQREAPLPTPRITSWDRRARPGGGLPGAAKPLWKRPLVQDPYDNDKDERQAKGWIDEAVKNAKGSLIPGFCPLVVGDLCIFHSYRDVRAVALADGKAVRAGEIVWETPGGHGPLGQLLHKHPQSGLFWPQIPALWKEWRRRGQLSWLCEQSLGGLSTDGANIWISDDMAVLPPPSFFQPIGILLSTAGEWESVQFGRRLRFLVCESRLCSFELKTEGKLTVVIGKERPDKSPAPPFSDTHFLGAALPLDRRLYALNEANNGELCVVRARPGSKGVEIARPLGFAQAHRRHLVDCRRRMNSSYLVAGDGVLVCPTHAGTVFGVDLLTERVLWTYAYHQEKPPVDARGTPQVVSDEIKIEWKASAPIIAGDRLVFTAPEEGSVHCLRLRDGMPLWKTPKKDDVYLGGAFGDKVILGGQTGCRALDLASGEESWRAVAGIPSGVGAASGGTYYLPLRSGSKSEKPEICAVDLARGTITGRVELDEPPGNLVFHNGLVLSQSATSIAAYRVKQK